MSFILYRECEKFSCRMLPWKKEIYVCLMVLCKCEIVLSRGYISHTLVKSVWKSDWYSMYILDQEKIEKTKKKFKWGEFGKII